MMGSPIPRVKNWASPLSPTGRGRKTFGNLKAPKLAFAPFKKGWKKVYARRVNQPCKGKKERGQKKSFKRDLF